MMHMLGDRTCMESLRKDITDLQGTVIDVFSRVGAVRYPSWKFPDTLSCDLDLAQLLEKYDHIDDEPEFTQLSHVVLLELVIDRLLLLLQSFTVYTEVISSDGGLPPARDLGSSMSIGLAVRKYWSSVLKLGSGYQQLKSVDKNVIQAKEKETTKEASQYPPSSRLQSTPMSSQRRNVIPSLTESQTCVAWDTRTIGCQTLESSLVPCDACDIAQSSLREVSEAIISVCLDQNLPCSLTKIQEILHPGRNLSPTEMRYWASEESKDLARINKHLSELMKMIIPLKNQVEAARVENDRLQQNIESGKKAMQAHKEELQMQAKESERRLHEKAQQSQKVLNKMEKDKEELRRGTAVLEERVSILKEELKSQHSVIRDLELAKNQLVHEMQSMVDKEKVTELEQTMNNLKLHLDTTMQHLKESEEAVSKERACVESLQSHKESLQVKQKSLLQQLDRLAQECENLHGSLEDAEEERTKLEEQMEKLDREKENLMSQIEEKQEAVKQLQKDKQSLEEAVSGMEKQLSRLQGSLKEEREKNKLLVSYPDLHIPPEFESTGDVAEDMEKQLQANNIRISILEEENLKLRANLSKLKEKHQLGQLKLVPQTQLWNNPHATEPTSLDLQRPQSSTMSTTPQIRSVAVCRDTTHSPAILQRERKGSSGSTRQALSFVTFPSESSSIAAYARVKQVKGKTRTPVGSDRK
ncbi:coiled-coil domain-containing protein 157 [Spea bombifrons]|uniref:coiled-coil domain-containing protein 157 n=1 Tax=Spea bombifrons TaxID=233779 RepID=UPI00234B527B|nr:coiled-coil domain-containing protein 157 [Spea bombifrons]